ncbi:MAG: hypothetical protein ACRD4G_13695 [Bryobacteraceae bacterium]
MRIFTKPWILFPVIAVAIGCLAFFLAWRRRPVTNSELVRMLPHQDDALFFVDFTLLRRAGIIKLLSPAAKGSPEYTQFVRQTDFDYSKDIDAIAGAVNGDQLVFLIRGQFDWRSLRRYAMHHGGHCKHKLCRVPALEPDRWISFRPLRSDVMVLRIGRPLSAKSKWVGEASGDPIPQAPVWIKLFPHVLHNPKRLPLALRFFATALEPARSVILSLQAARSGSGDAFQIQLHAQCASAATATAIANQLQLDTKFLKLALTRKHPNTSSTTLAEVLLAAKFHSAGTEAMGVWPVSKALVHSLE